MLSQNALIKVHVPGINALYEYRVGNYDLLGSLPCVRLSADYVKMFTLWLFTLFHSTMSFHVSFTCPLPPEIDVRSYLLPHWMIVILFFLCRWLFAKNKGLDQNNLVSLIRRQPTFSFWSAVSYTFNYLLWLLVYKHLNKNLISWLVGRLYFLRNTLILLADQDN